VAWIRFHLRSLKSGVQLSKIVLPISQFSAIDRQVRLSCILKCRVKKLKYQYSCRINLLTDIQKEHYQEDIDDLLFCINRLDHNTVICNTRKGVCIPKSGVCVYHEVLKVWKSFPKTHQEHVIRIFGSFTRKVYNPRLKLDYAELRYSKTKAPEDLKKVEDETFSYELLVKLVEDFRVGAQMGQISEMKRRLAIEVDYRSKHGWYVIFDSLTVRDGCMSKVFPPKGVKTSIWTDYIRSVDRLFAEASYGSVRKAAKARAAGQDYYNYFAIVERGSKTRRLHIHVVHCFKTLPGSFCDPNRAAFVPYYREVDSFKDLWTYGTSTPKAVRFFARDSFGYAGWRWPVERAQGSWRAMVAKPAASVVGYVSKYMTKSQNEEVGCIWRTRVSRRLGRQPLKEAIVPIPLQHRLVILQQVKVLRLWMGPVRLPRQMLRRLLVKSLPRSIYLRLFRRALLHQPINLLKLYRDLIERPRLCRIVNFGVTAITNLRLMDVSKYFPQGTFSVSLSGPTYAVNY